MTSATVNSSDPMAALYRMATSDDLPLIDALTPSERQWCARQMATRQDPRLLLAAMRSRAEFSRAPYFAQAHLSDLESWVGWASSRPVALGIAD